MSFITDRIKTEGLTFDDVLLVPAYSEVLPREVDITSKFTRNIRLNTPIVSAAMDTVTEAELAIAIAREGGIGVIHKNMSIAAQAAQVRKVKRAENGMIYDPITISKDNTVGDALKLMHDNKIGGIPVVNDANILIGIVTNRDLRFQRDMSRKIEEVMTCEGLVTTTNPDLAHAADILLQNKIEKLPVVDANGKLVGLLTYKDITKVQQNPNACKDAKGRLRVAAGVGVTPDSMDRVAALHDSQVDVVVLDSAHGHSKNIVNLLKQIKATYTDIDVVVGNIATGEAARYLADAGADGVKVGIGPGSICTTRVIAGVGVPQLEAIYDVAKALKGSDVGIIADGGLRYSGDIVKALAAGGDCVMAGSMFAGVEESPGETIIYNGRKFKTYRGMGSLEAMQCGSKDRYFQGNETDTKKLVPEGIAARVPFKGTLAEVIYQLVGGLRSGMGYVGAKNIEALKKAQFIRITNSGVQESHPHDVAITREAPNYSRGE
ncbi:MAG: IMP dehydrogenase [Rikenellaceae bacterium]|jgi:IMP dehydrogenase|nr:IMP dehydrogenase [Rikenellaceae bacterium]MBQ5371863.1 IMP dehydrogenase [Rikenellaceae bacterium]MBQ5595593.1 IMP dehydrogenase [Rikenellaceae bacterium]